MLVSARPVLPEAGIPYPGAMERWMGMGGFMDYFNKVLEKIELPGFGTPIYAPGTVIQKPQEVITRQAEGYPVGIPTLQDVQPQKNESTTDFNISAGAGVMLAGAAVLVALVMMSKGGGKH